MFTGLIETVGHIREARERNGGREFHIEAPLYAGQFTVGESIACDGCCLTVERFEGPMFQVFASPETLKKTTFGDRRAGGSVNLERALRLGDRLGGHLVSGHVDSFGTFLGAEDQGDSWRLSIGAPENILQLCIEKGSIAVDGISLTLVDVTNTGFSLWIIPETWKKTTLHLRKSGDRVNLEADQIGKYIRKSLEPWLGNAKEARLTDVMKRFAGG